MSSARLLPLSPVCTKGGKQGDFKNAIATHSSLQMSRRAVAAQACKLPTARVGMRRFDRIDDFFMTVTARLLGDLAAVRLDLNVVLVAARGEEKRMPKAIRRLSRILADEVCRRVAAIAGGDGTMRRLQPTVEFLAHDMAVGTSHWIVGEVRPAFRISKGVNTDADRDTDNHTDQDGLDGSRTHR
jgi:hypothetical protein